MFGEVEPPKGDRNGRIGWPVIKSKVCVGRDAQRGRCIVAGGTFQTAARSRRLRIRASNARN